MVRLRLRVKVRVRARVRVSSRVTVRNRMPSAPESTYMCPLSLSLTLTENNSLTTAPLTRSSAVAERPHDALCHLHGSMIRVR